MIVKCYSKDTLYGTVRFCNKYDIHLISDEIYALSVYNADNSHPGFTSALSIDLAGADKSLVHVLYGFSKVSFVFSLYTKFAAQPFRTLHLLV